MTDLFDAVADLPLSIGSTDRTRRERDTSSGFVRTTTTFHLSGPSPAKTDPREEPHVGRGEDVTYDTEDHDALADAPPFDLAGEYTFAEFSAHLDGVDLFPTKPPEREASRHYRRWAVESAALDLALRQNGLSLSAAVDRTPDPVRFVVSTRLGDPPTTERIATILDAYPDTEFKLDPTPEWDDALVADVAATGAVRILDLKGLYEGTEVDVDPDPALYGRLLSGFPDAVIEDPALTDETRSLFDGEEGRVSWDYPITGVESVESLPFDPEWLNVKPSRFGTVESLFATIEWAEARGVSLYGGGQFELGVGREHVQLLASLFYPEGPNDVAPGGYNDPDVAGDLPTSPLDAPRNELGLGWE
ncbi:enolase [Halobellus rufus]|uniref:enolase n=1 Tax=Halobellus rufus TaxID=1448860 RepID=UPI000678903E|nr:enolase [Halobellus rufus]